MRGCNYRLHSSVKTGPVDCHQTGQKAKEALLVWITQQNHRARSSRTLCGPEMAMKCLYDRMIPYSYAYELGGNKETQFLSLITWKNKVFVSPSDLLS